MFSIRKFLGHDERFFDLLEAGAEVVDDLVRTGGAGGHQAGGKKQDNGETDDGFHGQASLSAQ